MKELKQFILEKFKINSKNAKDIVKFDPDNLNSDEQIMYDSEDADENGENDIFYEDFMQEIKTLEKEYNYFLVSRFIPLSKLSTEKDYEKNLNDYSDELSLIIKRIMTGKDLGYEARLKYGHLEVDCINSGSRGTYYIYALSHEAYDEISAWFEGGWEEVESLNFLYNEKSILEIKL